jgi:hypothetical protein
MSDWKREFTEFLSDFAAPRTLSFEELQKAVQNCKPTATPATVRRLATALEGLALHKVKSGLWINMMTFPSASVGDVVGRIRNGAIVSLQTVLGDTGVANNFTEDFFCIIPRDPKSTTVPRTSKVTLLDGTEIHFKSISKTVLDRASPADSLNPQFRYARATPEAALIHWIYLAAHDKSTMRMPDTQAILDNLDEERLFRLADAFQVTDKTREWIADVRSHAEYEDSGLTRF